jgi:hypothetical protein
VPRLWYVRKQGEVRGPFPAGAVIQDRLVGRISAAHELSPDREEWRGFDAWPELSSALDAAPSATAGTAEPEWIRERARARLRWADERGAPDRRDGSEAASEPTERREQERRSTRGAEGGKRSSARTRPRFANERAILKIVAVVAVAAGLLALLAWLYGPVNPVPVRIR